MIALVKLLTGNNQNLSFNVEARTLKSLEDKAYFGTYIVTNDATGAPVSYSIFVGDLDKNAETLDVPVSLIRTSLLGSPKGKEAKQRLLDRGIQLGDL